MSESIESFVTRCVAIIKWHMEHLPQAAFAQWQEIRRQDTDTDASDPGTILAGCQARGWYLFTDGYPSGSVEEDGEEVGVWSNFCVAGPAEESVTLQNAILEDLVRHPVVRP